MNYYERHLGDYAKDAGHLSMMEHGAYGLLLDRYYTTEQPIPAEQAHRICRARTRDEKAAVDAVLAEFFTLAGGAYTNKRADQEIAKFQESAPEREAKQQNARERQQRARDRRKQLFDELRSHGVVPEYDATTGELQALLLRATSQRVTPPVTRDDTATQPQTPVTKHQEQNPPTPDGVAPPAISAVVSPLKAKDLESEGVERQHAADWLQLRKAKRLPLTLTAWADTKAEGAKAGLTPAQTVARAVANNWAGFKAAWADPQGALPANRPTAEPEWVTKQRDFAQILTGRKRSAPSPATDFVEVIDDTARLLG